MNTAQATVSKTFSKPGSQTAQSPLTHKVSAPRNPGQGTIRVLLADDHPVVRHGIASCLATKPHLALAAEAGDGQEAINKAKEVSPDVVLMDIDMPQVDGLRATEILLKEDPKLKVLVLSLHRRPEYVCRILQSGARGYISKNSSPDELCRAIETVHAGKPFFSADVAKVAVNRVVQGNGQTTEPHLSPREQQVLVEISGGFSNKEIAARIGVGVRTVESHRERLMRKLHLNSVAGLTRFAIARGLVELES